jgi:hypothetical protein
LTSEPILTMDPFPKMILVGFSNTKFCMVYLRFSLSRLSGLFRLFRHGAVGAVDLLLAPDWN